MFLKVQKSVRLYKNFKYQKSLFQIMLKLKKVLDHKNLQYQKNLYFEKMSSLRKVLTQKVKNSLSIGVKFTKGVNYTKFSYIKRSFFLMKKCEN